MKKKLNLYSIPCEWKMYGKLHVLAESREKAFEYAEQDAEDCVLPSNGEYLDDSFTVLYDDFDEGGSETHAITALGTGAHYWTFLRSMYELYAAVDKAKRCLEIKASDENEIQFQNELREAIKADNLVSALFHGDEK